MDNPTIFLGCPTRNRQWVIYDYLEAIRHIQYPKDSIVLNFLVNDSTDNTEQIIRDFISRMAPAYKRAFVDVIKTGTIPDSRDSATRTVIYSHLASMRNKWTQMRNGDEDYILSVDSDIIVHPQIINRLLDAKKDICSALISNDIAGRSRYFNILRFNGNSIQHLQPQEPRGLLKVDITGAVYLIKSSVLNNQEICYGYDQGGEDIYFCRKCREFGVEMWCDTSLELEHRMKHGSI